MARQAKPPAKTTARTVSKLSLDVAVASSVSVTVVLARSWAYSVSVMGSHMTVPVWPLTTVTEVT